jgi:hypothetical protein
MKSSLLLTLSAISLLTACDGGNGITEAKDGNGGGPGPGTGGGGLTVEITAANAVLVTKVSYQAALSSGELGGFSGDTGLLASDLSGISKLGGGLAIANKIGSSSANATITEVIEECPLGGTITTNANIANQQSLTLTPGDSFDIFYEICNDGFSVIDGSLFYEVDAFSGDLLTSLYSLTMTATFTDFQVATDEDQLVSNGDITVRIDTLQFPNIEAQVSGNSLTVDGSVSAMVMTNFSSLHTQNGAMNPSPYTQTSFGTLNSTLLSGVISYSTPVEFEGSDVDYPSSGEFLVTGSNSSVRLTAIDSVDVRVDIDIDGDGIIDETVNTTWAELEAS